MGDFTGDGVSHRHKAKQPNGEVFVPEERCWLYTMIGATTGQAMKKGVAWRKAMRAAIADNPFVKGEGLSPKAWCELLGHSQLSLSL